MRLHRHRGGDRAVATRFQLRQRLLSIGDDYWIEDDEGHRVFRVDGKALRIRKTFVLEDAAGNEVARMQERKLSVRDTMHIERNGDPVATVRKAMFGFRDRFSIDLPGGDELEAKGNLADHEYEVRRNDHPVVTVSKRWFALRDTYGVEVMPGEDLALALAITVCIDALSHPGD